MRGARVATALTVATFMLLRSCDVRNPLPTRQAAVIYEQRHTMQRYKPQTCDRHDLSILSSLYCITSTTSIKCPRFLKSSLRQYPTGRRL
jgi:hypothetical protein